MNWLDELSNLILSGVLGLGNVANKVLPQHWRRRARERLNDFNPYNVIAANHDLMCAVRLAWVEAALAVLTAAKNSAESGREFEDKTHILSFISHTQNKLLEIRSTALDRRPNPDYSPIDQHLKIIIEGTPKFIAGGENQGLDQSLTEDFGKTLAAITGWRENDIPRQVNEIARDGLLTVDKSAKRPFGELVFASFAETLKSPDKYPEAKEAFKMAMQDAARQLSEEMLRCIYGVDEKIDRVIDKLDALTIIQQGAQIYLQMLPQLLEGQQRIEAGVRDLQDGQSKILQKLDVIDPKDKTSTEALTQHQKQELRERLSQGKFTEILACKPTSLAMYRAQCIAVWEQPSYAIDKQFTPLTLLRDQGEDSPGERYQKSREKYDDLRDILAAVDGDNQPVIVVTGAPGSGKSTLLRKLEIDIAWQALCSDNNEALSAPVTLFLELGRYGRRNEPPPEPSTWLETQWAQKFAGPQKFAELLYQPLILLFDGLNEMPHADPDDYEIRLQDWKNFLDNLKQRHKKVRAIFTCRTRDYGIKLTTKELPYVPQVEITPLDDTQIEKFLQKYSPDKAKAQQLWGQLKNSQQLELYRSPYYLRLLINQVEDDGIPAGRAALFTGFVRAMLKREVDGDNRRMQINELLTRRDRERVGQWRDAYELPKGGKLFNTLSEFAFQLQSQQEDGATCNTANKRQEVIISFDDALEYLSQLIPDEQLQEDLLYTAVDLQILDMPGNDVKFVHQLLQEYFAARHVAERINAVKKANDRQQYTPLAKLAATAWRAADISPRLKQALETTARSGTLEDLPTTGWEETFMLALEMMEVPEDFLCALAAVNLPLAGRCAAQPDVKISASLRQDLQQQLVRRSRDPATDLRARIHAGHALGALGDPRFTSRQGPEGCRFLLPPMVEIEGGAYSIGSDEGLDENEAPRHEVELTSFALGQFPVTNAEFKYFIDAGGYQEKRWWDTPAAQRWQNGEDTNKGARMFIRHWRDRFMGNPDLLSRKAEEYALSKDDVEFWQNYCSLSDDAFEARLTKDFGDQRYTQPAFWNDPRFKAPNQPVVGICWFEARAYCNWLSHQSGQSFRLPTEAQWEAAASGKNSRRYAWGDTFDATRCNALDTKLRRTTPVGVFPDGVTPCGANNQGIADLSGNVWEWTSSCFAPYPYQAEDGREAADSAQARVLRGGSCNNLPDLLRAAARFLNPPDNRSDRLGFRVLCSSPIE